MNLNAKEFKLYDNIFIETNLQSPDYDGVIIILYPNDQNVQLPRHIKSFVENMTRLDKSVTKVTTFWNCDYVSGGRLIVSPTGKITPYHDASVIFEAAKKGVQRAVEAGVTRPLVIVQNAVEFPSGQLVCILGTLDALYIPLQMFERENYRSVTKIGFFTEEETPEPFERTVRNAIALEHAKILTKHIAGADPERMCPQRVLEFVKESFAEDKNVSIKVCDDDAIIAKEYPLLAAVNRAANNIQRYKAKVVEMEYKPSDPARVTETIVLVGKGVTYDTGGADIKVSGKMVGMSGDKSGAAAVAGFIKACSILKPPHLKVIGILCLCRNSVGSESYVADELLVSASGKTIRVTNTDAEGRLAMADALYKAAKFAENELNPHVYTIATLTGHAMACFGKNTGAMDNYTAKAVGHSSRLQLSGSRIGEGIEVSTIKPIDFSVNSGKLKGDDLLQFPKDAQSRNHQLAAGFLMRVSGLDEKNVKYTHLDIAGSAGMPPEEPTAVPILSLCHLHKVFI